MPNALFLWHSFQIACKFLWRKRTEGVQEAQGYPLEPFRRRVDELPESALDFCWLGSSVAPSYLALHVGLLSPLHSFMMTKDHTVHVLKCHLTAFSSIEFLKLHYFLKMNSFGSPCKLDVLEGNWVPIEKRNGFIPFLYISLLQVPGDLAKMTIAELKKWSLK